MGRVCRYGTSCRMRSHHAHRPIRGKRSSGSGFERPGSCQELACALDTGNGKPAPGHGFAFKQPELRVRVELAGACEWRNSQHESGSAPTGSRQWKLPSQPVGHCRCIDRRERLKTEREPVETEGDARVVERCLEHIEALRVELGTATEAIVTNVISEFEQSIARQQELLGSLAVSLPAARALAATSNRKDRGAVFSRLDRASVDLCKVSARYAALLVLSSRCARQMQSLYQMTSPIAGSAGMCLGLPGESWSLSA